MAVATGVSLAATHLPPPSAGGAPALAPALFARMEEETVRITDAGGRMVLPPLVHPAPVERALFSPDERLVCIVWGGHFARVWDTLTGEPVTPPFAHPDSGEIAWSPDGRRLATFGKSKEVRIWDFTPVHRDPEAMKVLARLLSAHRFVPGSEHGLIPLSADELRTAWEQAGAAQLQ